MSWGIIGEKVRGRSICMGMVTGGHGGGWRTGEERPASSEEVVNKEIVLVALANY